MDEKLRVGQERFSCLCKREEHEDVRSAVVAVYGGVNGNMKFFNSSGRYRSRQGI